MRGLAHGAVRVLNSDPHALESSPSGVDMAQIALRLARLGDAPRIAILSRTLIEAGLPWSWTPRRVANHMRSREPLSVIAVDGGELAGFVLAQFGSRAVHVALLGVGPAHQRSGTGQQPASGGERG